MAASTAPPQRCDRPADRGAAGLECDQASARCQRRHISWPACACSRCPSSPATAHLEHNGRLPGAGLLQHHRRVPPVDEVPQAGHRRLGACVAMGARGGMGVMQEGRAGGVQGGHQARGGCRGARRACCTDGASNWAQHSTQRTWWPHHVQLRVALAPQPHDQPAKAGQGGGVGCKCGAQARPCLEGEAGRVAVTGGGLLRAACSVVRLPERRAHTPGRSLCSSTSRAKPSGTLNRY